MGQPLEAEFTEYSLQAFAAEPSVCAKFSNIPKCVGESVIVTWCAE